MQVPLPVIQWVAPSPLSFLELEQDAGQRAKLHEGDWHRAMLELGGPGSAGKSHQQKEAMSLSGDGDQ